MSTPTTAEVLTFQLRHAWLTARRLVDDLTDEEYTWEPASPCWSVRRRGPTVRGWGSGDVVCEDAWPPPDPLPTTTIAWRVIHLAAWTDIYRLHAFAGERPDLNDVVVPQGCEVGVAWLLRAQDDFIAAVEGLDDVALFEPRPAHWGASVPTIQLVSTMLTEHIHHIAEIGVLRDLHRGHATTQRDVPVEAPAWWGGHPAGP